MGAAAQSSFMLVSFVGVLLFHKSSFFKAAAAAAAASSCCLEDAMDAQEPDEISWWFALGALSQDAEEFIFGVRVRLDEDDAGAIFFFFFFLHENPKKNHLLLFSLYLFRVD